MHHFKFVSHAALSSLSLNAVVINIYCIKCNLLIDCNRKALEGEHHDLWRSNVQEFMRDIPLTKMCVCMALLTEVILNVYDWCFELKVFSY